MLLVSGTTRSVGKLAQSHPRRLGHLLTPRNRNSVASVLATGLHWAIDNGAFSGFDATAFRRLLDRAAGQPRLLWVVCPDVVADADATLRLFDEWQSQLKATGVPVAFVGQDGQEDLQLPWERFDCLFIGGSTKWKLSAAAGDLAIEAKQRRKWVHMGRVNSLRRMRVAQLMQSDSIDGSSASMFGDKYIHKYLQWIEMLDRQPVLFC